MPSMMVAMLTGKPSLARTSATSVEFACILLSDIVICVYGGKLPHCLKCAAALDWTRITATADFKCIGGRKDGQSRDKERSYPEEHFAKYHGATERY